MNEHATDRAGRAALAPLARPTLESLEARQFLSAASTSAEFKVVRLTANQAGIGNNTDANLVDPRGISIDASGNLWVADAGTRKLTSYSATGTPNTAATDIFRVNSAPDEMPADPTAVLVNPDISEGDFNISANGNTAASALVVASGGTIQGASKVVSTTETVLAIDDTGASANFTGAAIATVGGGPELFADDFNAGSINVYGTDFAIVLNLGRFNDPELPSGFAPYNITTIGDDLFVTYVRQSDDVPAPGAGDGLVDIYDSGGNLISRIAQGSQLNEPWGVVKAPANFGRFSNDLLISNADSGLISAFNSHGQFRGYLLDRNGHAIKIPGVAGLTFGTTSGDDSQSLFFTADGSQGQSGTLGRITLLG
jgi:uncharacterized protein (TIGR03118 family)